jgi:hypothetical protein
MIRTLKQYLLDILMTFTIDQLHTEFLKYKPKAEEAYKTSISFVDYLLEFACEINNNKEHRTIHAIPEKVFGRVETNKQKINRVYYPLYPPDTIVIKRPESKGLFSNRIFNFDPEPYVITTNIGRKFRLIKLIDKIEGKTHYTSKYYQPYEIRAFKTGEEFMNYLNSDLIKNSLIKLYGIKRYGAIVNWFRPRVDSYTDWIKKFI